jgi:predicted nicotinamide N-methyase
MNELDFPFSLAGLYSDANTRRDDKEIAEGNEGNHHADDADDGSCANDHFVQIYEQSSVTVIDIQLNIRQFAFHTTNANRVWPSTFVLAEYVLPYLLEWNNKRILEIGAGTGVLSMWLLKHGLHHVHTSDYAPASPDEQDEIQENIQHNYALNGLPPAIHIPHTWGTPWRPATTTGSTVPSYDIVLGSDLLLYVNAYPALVTTLSFLIQICNPNATFIMAWNRKRLTNHCIQSFFTQMTESGFRYQHMGKGVFIFTSCELPATNISTTSTSSDVSFPDDERTPAVLLGNTSQ